VDAREAASVEDRRLLYVDPWAGVSGDMLLGALLDTDREDGDLEVGLRRALAALDLGRYTVEVGVDVEWGVTCTRLRVDVEDSPPLRRLADLERILADSNLSISVRDRSLRAVRRLAAVEAEIHGCQAAEIHFHEVGAVDTLVDIVGVFALVETLRVSQVIIGPIPLGGGTVEIAHGRMGVPAPATAVLLKDYPVLGGPELLELTTPTGALLVTELHAFPGPLPAMRVERVGYGGGSMKLEGGPNVLRVLLGHSGDQPGLPKEDVGLMDAVVELQTNLDDVSPEVIGHTCGLLRGAGALDVWTVPAQMKKSRPGVVIHALVPSEAEEVAADILFAQTGTLGVRRQTISRHLAARGAVTVAVEGREVRVKWGRWRERLVSIAPEYDDVAQVAEATGLSVREVMRRAAETASTLLAAERPGQ
jgi:pyridinium-3,5-bisthiocarboxylic acid mononucleotide nickel chelatase